jgi:hypothetical protein
MRCTLTSPVEGPFSVLSISISERPSILIGGQAKYNQPPGRTGGDLSYKSSGDGKGRSFFEERLATLKPATCRDRPQL